MDAPPSRTEWALEGELRGHSPAEVIAWASATADWEDEQVQRRELPAYVILADAAEPRWLGRLRRFTGRGG
jgi:hypothetical protein